jgi:hypothetical protein
VGGDELQPFLKPTKGAGAGCRFERIEQGDIPGIGNKHDYVLRVISDGHPRNTAFL